MLPNRPVSFMKNGRALKRATINPCKLTGRPARDDGAAVIG
jgi:hypothetical protein